MRKHLGIRPFTCDREGCGRSYTSVAELNQHKYVDLHIHFKRFTFTKACLHVPYPSPSSSPFRGPCDGASSVHCRTRTRIPVLCRFFLLVVIRTLVPNWNVYNWDRNLSFGQRSVPKKGTLTIWERDPNPNLSPSLSIGNMFWRRMHSSRMRTARSSSRLGGWGSLHQAPPGAGTPRPGTPKDQTPPRSRHPREQAPPWEQAPPGTRHPPGAGTPPPWTEFLTHACENITLPQTSFAGGNNTM